jgi:hypothetical protein
VQPPEFMSAKTGSGPGLKSFKISSKVKFRKAKPERLIFRNVHTGKVMTATQFQKLLARDLIAAYRKFVKDNK